MYEKEIANSSLKNSKSYFSVEKQNSIVEIYLKGISIKDLALQFDCSLQILEQILYNKGIEIVDQKQPKRTNRFRKKGTRN